MGNVKRCGGSKKFDKGRNQCHDEEHVNSFCYGPVHSASSSSGLCRDKRTGWESRNECREYYWCDLGYADVIYDCGRDLLFDKNLELCVFTSQLDCHDSGVAQPPAETLTIRPGPVTIVTLAPAGLIGGTITSRPTSTPSTQQSSYETPPWLTNTVFTTNNVGRIFGTHHQIRLIVATCYAVQTYLIH
jgi:hypothetical protein